ncbi:hypothetical protein D3C72_1684200 [compost metagenome]
MGGHDYHRQQINAHQRRATEQQRQTFQRARMFTRQFWQQLDQTQQGNQRAQADREESGAPAKILPDDSTQRQTQHHRQRRTGRQQTERLCTFTGRCQTYGERGGNRPENRVRKGNANAAYHQHGKVPRQEGKHVAGDKQHKQPDQQFSAFHLAGQQHKGQ